MIWVMGFTEDNRLSSASFEAIEAGSILAGPGGSRLNLIIPCTPGANPPAGAEKKADNVYMAESPLLASYTLYGYLKAAAHILKGRGVTAVIMPGTVGGKDLAPLLAVSIGAICVPNAVSLGVKDGVIDITRPLYGGKVLETLSIRAPAVISTMPRSFVPSGRADRDGIVNRIACEIAGSDIKVRSKGLTELAGKKDLKEADVIVSGGRGLGGPVGFRLIEELAKELGAVVGASRAVVDAGWADHSMQVGQTGKTVSPKLYVACGISGAPQHIAGMRQARYVMAINKDPSAPIFKECDLGITGDVAEAIPLLIKEIREARLKGRTP